MSEPRHLCLHSHILFILLILSRFSFRSVQSEEQSNNRTDRAPAPRNCVVIR